MPPPKNGFEIQMTVRERCLAAAMRRQINEDMSWAHGLDGMHHTRERASLAALTRLVRQPTHVPPVQRTAGAKRVALPRAFAAMLDVVCPVPHWTASTGHTASRIPASDPLVRITGEYKSVQTLHKEKLQWDAQLAAERTRKRKLREELEDAEWARSNASLP